MIRLRYIGREEAELETHDLVILFAYCAPIALYDRVKEQHYQTEEHMSPSTQIILDKWLRGRNATGKTIRIPQFSLETVIDPYNHKKK